MTSLTRTQRLSASSRRGARTRKQLDRELPVRLERRERNKPSRLDLRHSKSTP